MHALFVDHLSVIDFAYFHPQRGIVGESLILDIELFGELNDEGMLFDFSFVKKRIKECVDQLADHKLVVPTDNPKVTQSQTAQQISLTMQTENGRVIHHSSPAEAVFLVNAEHINSNTLSRALDHAIRAVVPENVKQIAIKLRPEKCEQPYYHYAHGLKKHFGDCQRIAHGHRSKVEVWSDGQYNSKLAGEIANEWQDIYLATEEDICERLNIDGTDYYRFQYRANQGDFELTMAADRCEILASDTTVELIAVHLCQKLKRQHPDKQIKVKAFEGVDKGAIAYSDD